LKSVIRKKYKVIIADDHAIVRSGLRNLLEKEEYIIVIGEAENGEELMTLLEQVECDLVILDLSMPKLNGLEAIKILKKKHSKLKILVLSMHKEREFFRKAISRGIDGYILKDDNLNKVIQGLQDIMNGKKYFSSELSSFVIDDYVVLYDNDLSTSLLTRREMDVLKLIASGQMNKEIATELKIGIRTVETHRANIMEKLKIRNVAGLTKYAISRGII